MKNISPQFKLKATKTNNWKNRHGRHYGGNTYVSLMVENIKGSTKGHTMDMNNVASPKRNLDGNECRKSSSAQREVRIDTNIRIDVEDENKSNCIRHCKHGEPKLLLKNRSALIVITPTWNCEKAAAKTTVEIKVPTSMLEFAVFFIRSSTHLCEDLYALG